MTIIDPPEIEYGFVRGRFLYTSDDTLNDPDRWPDINPIEGQVTFAPKRVQWLYGGATPATVLRDPQVARIDERGWIADAEAAQDSTLEPGVWLPVGQYDVRVSSPQHNVVPFSVSVTSEHTYDSPLDLTEAIPEEVPDGFVKVVTAEDRIRAEAARDAAEGHAHEAQGYADDAAEFSQTGTFQDFVERAEDAADESQNHVQAAGVQADRAESHVQETGVNADRAETAAAYAETQGDRAEYEADRAGQRVQDAIDDADWTGPQGERGETGPEGPRGPQGAPGTSAGDSAYTVAVQQGFDGSEEAWLESLRGGDGIGIHGVISEPTDIDELRTTGDVGIYGARIVNLVNGPPAETGLVVLLEVLYGASNGIVQRVTTTTDVWWRIASSNDEWGPWRRLARVDEIVPATHGVLSEETDIDDFRNESHIGTYVARADNLDGGPPVSGSNPLVALEVHWGTSNGVIQRATTNTEAWWRGAASSSAWGPWRRYATADDLDGIGGGSGIEYDDDGTPYIADGAGENPQPASRRLVTEESLTDLTTTSATVRRIVTSTDPDEPLQDGDLLLVYGE